MDNLGGRISTRVCERCGKAYQGRGYRFCSKECATGGTGTCKRCGRAFQRKREGQVFCGSCRPPESRECAFCGKAFKPRGDRKFCSKDCYESARAHKPEPCRVCGKDCLKGRVFCSKECRCRFRGSGTARVCQQCGKEFHRENHKGKAPKYCSQECAWAAQKKEEVKVCQQCGKMFHPHSMAKGLYCSHQCAGIAARTNACSVCGRWIPSGRVFCPNCRGPEGGENYLGYESQFEDMIEWMERLSSSIRACEVCGRTFYTARPNQLCCSQECSRRRNNLRHDRRIYRNGLPDLTITLDRLFIRDGGRCSACGLLLSFDGDPNGDFYPSIDHILPLSRGGLHAWDNVQLMCRRCNWIKRDAVGGRVPATGLQSPELDE